MKAKIYEYSAYLITTENKIQKLNICDYKKANFEQQKLFTAMLNFGYIEFENGIFKILDRDIVHFWNYSKDSLLNNMSLEDYYSILGISKPYKNQLPTLKETETFNSNAYQMTVVWVNNNSSGIVTAPKAYKRDGLELYNFDDENIGSLFPEYYELYEIIDKANNEWKDWTMKDRYDFILELKNKSLPKKIIIPSTLIQAIKHISTI